MTKNDVIKTIWDWGEKIEHNSYNLQDDVRTLYDVIAYLNERPCWTSVDDKLPAPGERVIVTNRTFTGEAYQGKDGCWHRHYGLKWECAFNGPDITHWMPMPQLRKDEL